MNNNWALILGASSGIGAECAIELAKNGINIYGVYLRKKQDHIDNLKNEIEQYNVQAVFKKSNIAKENNRYEIIEELCQFKNLKIKLFIHSVAFGTLKNMIDDNKQSLNHKNIEMTMDVMANSLVYWSQGLFHNKLLTKGSHILAMTSAGGRKNWQNFSRRFW